MNLKFFLLTLLLTISVIAPSKVIASTEVESLSYSEFKSHVYPEVDGPFVILFGSNYCDNCKSQLKLLKRKALIYGDKVNFYRVNADIDENYEWLVSVAQERKFDELGAPSWLFYYGDFHEDDIRHRVAYSCAGMMQESMMDTVLKDIINWYYR